MERASISSPSQKKNLAEPPRGFFKQLLAESVKEWKLSPRLVSLIALAPIFIALAGVMTALIGGKIYHFFTAEDRFAENLQVFLWLLAFGLGFVVIKRHWQAGRHVMALLYLCLNAGIFVIIGDEVSWGQRILGLETPAALKTINRQREINIHSLEGMIGTFRALYLIIGAYGTFLPLLFIRPQTFARRRAVISMLVPHYTLVLYFLATLAWRAYVSFWRLPDQYYFVMTKYSEVIELILAMGFFLFMSFQLRKISEDG
ncbi:MAG: hypothetical protein ONB46_04745 [candidate division KSB1 bacterium]|nr:hypothetical protein [candidate division KSB1 bacterium]MDZ7365701.1 hypothetical protein [candidate division KSB1 bacterium]MDZ7403223.1 hypothetical protein [candidate division KSB1 bacterium]